VGWLFQPLAGCAPKTSRSLSRTVSGDFCTYGTTPLERLDTEPGLREVEDMFTVIDQTGAA
jgi:hypothetical protein